MKAIIENRLYNQRQYTPKIETEFLSILDCIWICNNEKDLRQFFSSALLFFRIEFGTAGMAVYQINLLTMTNYPECLIFVKF